MPGVLRTRSLVCRKENTRVSHHRSAETIRHSLRNGLRLIRDLPGVPGFLATVASWIDTTKLDPSVGGSGPHDFAVRSELIRPRETALEPKRPSHPASNVRDDRETPLVWRRDARR
jgi:hypothetical protein